MDKPEQTMTKTIHSLKRLQNSINGNPTYRVTFTDGTAAKTKRDAGFAYAISPSSWEGKPVAVTFERGTIVGMDLL